MMGASPKKMRQQLSTHCFAIYTLPKCIKIVITKVMINEMSGRTMTTSSCRQAIAAFLGGLPGRVSEGSFVLLKPSTASALSSSSSALNKTSGSGSAAAVGSAPIVIGSEAVVTGLCRQDAMGGMVSAIDPSNRTCEIVVFDRSADTSSKHSCGMTVRAVRAQLPDVVSAEEVPILFDDQLDVGALIGASLNEAIDCLFSSTSDRREAKEKEAESGEENESDSSDTLDSIGSSDEIGFLTRSILSIRASTVALSDKQAMLRFIESSNLSSRNILSKMLELASSAQRRCSYETANAAFSESISSTPEHEARYLHLRRMLAEAMTRQAAFKSKSIGDWEELMDRPKWSASSRASAKASDEEAGRGNSASTYASPPAASATRVVSDQSAASSFASSRGRESEDTERATNREGASGRTTSSMEYDKDEDDEDDDGGNGEEEEAEDEEDEDLREAAIVQMAELGLPRSWAELALRRVGGTNIEAAVHFCLERGGDMERLLAEERERERRMTSDSSTASRRRNAGGVGGNNYLIQQLVEMGFPSHWCAEALAATGTGNVDEALTWILTNGERLSAQDTNDEDDQGTYRAAAVATLLLLQGFGAFIPLPHLH